MNAFDCFDLNDYLTNAQTYFKRLTLVNFRNYTYLRLNINQPFIVLSGENGSGKTNILEALSFFSQGRGLRNAKLSEVKTFNFCATPATAFINSNGWAVSAQIERQGEEYTIGTAVESQLKEVDYNETKEIERRIVHINNQRLSSQNELGNYISIIWVTPQMDRLFQAGTQFRRSFLDRIVYTFDVEHARRLSSYDNLYRQWLQILKSGRIDNNWLLSLEEQLAEIGVAIAAARRERVQKLNNFIDKNPDDIFPDAILSLDGTIESLLDEKPAVYVEDFYRESLYNQRRHILFNENETGIGKTDLKVTYKKKNVPANLCSTGEQKSLLLNIILAQTRSIIATQSTTPVLLLDEVAAHLDSSKRNALLGKLADLKTQNWLTTTSLFEFTSLKEVAQFFEIKDNTVKEIFLG